MLWEMAGGALRWRKKVQNHSQAWSRWCNFQPSETSAGLWCSPGWRSSQWSESSLGGRKKDCSLLLLLFFRLTSEAMTLTAHVENFGQGHFNHRPSAAVTQHVKLRTNIKPSAFHRILITKKKKKLHIFRTSSTTTRPRFSILPHSIRELTRLWAFSIVAM